MVFSKNSSRYILPVLRLPVWLRKTLSAPQGTLFIPKTNVIKSYDIQVDFAIGDIVSRTLKASIKVIDGKTRRIKELPYTGKSDVTIINPQGTLSLNSKTLLKEKDINTIFVLGEEDLLGLGVSLEKDNIIFAYGQPRVGFVLVHTNTVRARKLLKTFKPDIVVYNKVKENQETGIRP